MPVPPGSGLRRSAASRGRGRATGFSSSSVDHDGRYRRLRKPRAALRPAHRQRRTPLAWIEGLAPVNGSTRGGRTCDVLAPGSLLFGQHLRHQNLREVALDQPGAAPRLLAAGSSIDRQPTYSPDGQHDPLLLQPRRQPRPLGARAGDRRATTADRRPGPGLGPRLHARWAKDPLVERPQRQPGGWIAKADGSGARQLIHDGQSTPRTRPPLRRAAGSSTGAATASGQGSGRCTPTAPARSGWPRPMRSPPTCRRTAATSLFVEQDRCVPRGTGSASSTSPAVTSCAVSGSRCPSASARSRSSGAVPAGRRDGRSIYFVGEDEQGLSGVYRQDFHPAATRPPAADRSPASRRSTSPSRSACSPTAPA